MLLLSTSRPLRARAATHPLRKRVLQLYSSTCDPCPRDPGWGEGTITRRGQGASVGCHPCTEQPQWNSTKVYCSNALLCIGAHNCVVALHSPEVGRQTCREAAQGCSSFPVHALAVRRRTRCSGGAPSHSLCLRYTTALSALAVRRCTRCSDGAPLPSAHWRYPTALSALAVHRRTQSLAERHAHALAGAPKATAGTPSHTGGAPLRWHAHACCSDTALFTGGTEAVHRREQRRYATVHCGRPLCTVT